MRKCLIIVIGWLGDSLFASSIAERLKSENQYDVIDYLIGFPQTQPLLELNPYIDKVHVSPEYGPYPSTHYIDLNEYNDVFRLPVNDLTDPPTIKFQKHCGVRNIRTEYEVNTLDQYDSIFHSMPKNRINIGICSTWKDKNEQYYHSDDLIKILEDNKHFNLFKIGLPPTTNQYQGAEISNYYLFTASLCKFCDWVIGSEGGLTNLAAGVGTRVIYTTDFTYGLFGPNGRMYKYQDPLSKIGPRAFFPNKGHIALPPDTNYFDLPEIITKKIYENRGQI
jgi:ADP-heptose:LPS heptosyltransferase